YVPNTFGFQGKDTLHGHRPNRQSRRAQRLDDSLIGLQIHGGNARLVSLGGETIDTAPRCVAHAVAADPRAVPVGDEDASARRHANVRWREPVVGTLDHVFAVHVVAGPVRFQVVAADVARAGVGV